MGVKGGSRVLLGVATLVGLTGATEGQNRPADWPLFRGGQRHVGAALLRARYFPAAGVASGFPFSTMYVASTRAGAALLFVAL
jgi:hypothetical protein